MSTRTTVEVTAPDGTRWQVRRRWLPRLGHETLWGRFRRRTRKAGRRSGEVLGEAPSGCLDVVGEGLGTAIALIAIVLILAFIVIPLAVALVDVVILLLLLVIGVVVRILFRRPWVVEASRVPPDPARGSLRWRVVGWRASAERCTEVARSLATGVTPPDAELHITRPGPT